MYCIATVVLLSISINLVALYRMSHMILCKSEKKIEINITLFELNFNVCTYLQRQFRNEEGNILWLDRL